MQNDTSFGGTATSTDATTSYDESWMEEQKENLFMFRKKKEKSTVFYKVSI